MYKSEVFVVFQQIISKSKSKKIYFLINRQLYKQMKLRMCPVERGKH